MRSGAITLAAGRSHSHKTATYSRCAPNGSSRISKLEGPSHGGQSNRRCMFPTRCTRRRDERHDARQGPVDFFGEYFFPWLRSLQETDAAIQENSVSGRLRRELASSAPDRDRTGARTQG